MNEGFKINKNGELTYLTIPSFEEKGLVTHCFTTRHGGVSEGPYATMNLHFTKNDKRENVIENMKIISREIGINWENLVSTNQTHTDKILTVTKDNLGMGITKESWAEGFDGLITDCREVPLIAYSADCVLLAFLDPVKKVIGLAHSGWKGTVLKIGEKMLKKMNEDFGTSPSDCLVGIGPSIGKECFEVEEEVIVEFREKFSYSESYIKKKDDIKYLIDLWGLNRELLIEAGVKPKNITISNFCTKCDMDLFFSYRGMNGKNGSLAAIIALK